MLVASLRLQLHLHKLWGAWSCLLSDRLSVESNHNEGLPFAAQQGASFDTAHPVAAVAARTRYDCNTTSYLSVWLVLEEHTLISSRYHDPDSMLTIMAAKGPNSGARKLTSST